MNKEYLKKLVEFGCTLYEDSGNDAIWEENLDKVFGLLCEDLEDTIEYIDTCSQDELDFICPLLEGVSKHFQSQELIDCVERNITRFDDWELQADLATELSFMKMYV